MRVLGHMRQENPSGHRGYAFGPFVVDPVKRTLSRAGRPVPITSKTFDVLVVLLEHRDHIVSKDELLTRVWPDTAVNENNLTRQISSLRRVLGQRPDEHDFVVTIPGHGYRFVASVQPLPEATSEPPSDPSPAAGAPEVPWRDPPKPWVDVEESRVGGEPPPEPWSPVETDKADAAAANTPKARLPLAGTLVAASGAVLAIVLIGILLRPRIRVRRRDERCSASPMTKRRCRETRRGRPTVSGLSTQAAVPGTATSGSSGREIPTPCA